LIVAGVLVSSRRRSGSHGACTHLETGRGRVTVPAGCGRAEPRRLSERAVAVIAIGFAAVAVGAVAQIVRLIWRPAS
jgi:hypothetical protein